MTPWPEVRAVKIEALADGGGGSVFKKPTASLVIETADYTVAFILAMQAAQLKFATRSVDTVLGTDRGGGMIPIPPSAYKYKRFHAWKWWAATLVWGFCLVWLWPLVIVHARP